jgi:hypothetical protein
MKLMGATAQITANSISTLQDSDDSKQQEINRLFQGCFGKWILVLTAQYLTDTQLTLAGYRFMTELLSKNSTTVEHTLHAEKNILSLTFQINVLKSARCHSLSAMATSDIKNTLGELSALHQDAKFSKGKTKSIPTTNVGSDSVLLVTMFVSLLDLTCPLQGSSLSSTNFGLSRPAAYVSGALKALNGFVSSVMEDRLDFANLNFGVSPSQSHIFHVLPQSFSKLFHYLGLFGRSTDQAMMISELKKLTSKFAAAGNGLLQQSWIRAIAELIVVDDIRRVWENQLVPASGNSMASCVLIRSADSANGDPLTLWAADFAVFISQSTAMTTTQEGICVQDYCELMEKLVQRAPSQRDSSMCGAKSPIGYPITSLLLARIWILLLGAKSLMCCCGDHKKSAETVWQALSLIGSLWSSARENSPPYCLEALAVKAEAFILMGELFELAGSLDMAASYVSEALWIAKLNESFTGLKSVVEFHSCRLWFRGSSSRFVLTITGLAEDDPSSQGLPEYESDVVTKQLRAVAKVLAVLLNVDVDDSAPRHVATTKDTAVFSFRSLSLYWDIDGLRNRPYLLRDGQVDIHSQPFMYHCPLGSFKGNNLADIGRNGIKRESEESLAFDVARDLRRLACSRQVSTPPNDFHSFVLGASSIGTSHEMLESLESIITKSTSSEKPNRTGRFARMCAGDESQLDAFISQLKSSVNFIGPTAMTLIYACIEPEHGDLLLGRLELGRNTSPEVVKLPIGEALRSFLVSWESLMTRQKQQLTATSTGTLDKWTEKDKKNWWKERMSVDSDIALHLQQFEELLGTSTQLLMVNDKVAHAADDELSTAMANLSVDPSTNETSSSKMKSKTAKAKTSKTTLPVDSVADAENNASSEQYTAEFLKSKTVPKLKEILKSLGVESAGKKDELIEKILALTAPATKPTTGGSQSASSSPITNSEITASSPLGSSGSVNHVMLLVDERLQQIPLECMPCLRNQQCTRIPSLTVLMRSLENVSNTVSGDKQAAAPAVKSKAKKSPASASSSNCVSDMTPLIKRQQVNVDKCWYVLDPESNLPGTRETMYTFIEPYSIKWNWVGSVATIPDLDTLR